MSEGQDTAKTLLRPLVISWWFALVVDGAQAAEGDFREKNPKDRPTAEKNLHRDATATSCGPGVFLLQYRAITLDIFPISRAERSTGHRHPQQRHELWEVTPQHRVQHPRGTHVLCLLPQPGVPGSEELVGEYMLCFQSCPSPQNTQKTQPHVPDHAAASAFPPSHRHPGSSPEHIQYQALQG